MLGLLFMLSALPSAVSVNKGITHDYCNEETFNAECGSGKVVLMKTAFYGRMNKSRCVHKDYGNDGLCKKDVLPVLHHACSGHQSCSILILDSTLGKVDLCSELKSYLHVSYSCIEVADHDSCFLKANSGFVASSHTGTINCGNGKTPWIINVQRTQKVHFTLITFSEHKSGSCKGLSIMLGDRNVHTMCATNRGSSTYVSSGGKLSAYFDEPTRANNLSFILEFRVTGCAEPELPSGMLLKIQGDHVTVSCRATQKESKLECRNGIWYGDLPSCSESTSDENTPAANQPTKPGENAPSANQPAKPGSGFVIVFNMIVLVVILAFISFLIYRRLQKNTKIGGRRVPEDSIRSVSMSGNAGTLSSPWFPQAAWQRNLPCEQENVYAEVMKPKSATVKPEPFYYVLENPKCTQV